MKLLGARQSKSAIIDVTSMNRRDARAQEAIHAEDKELGKRLQSITHKRLTMALVQTQCENKLCKVGTDANAERTVNTQLLMNRRRRRRSSSRIRC